MPSPIGHAVAGAAAGWAVAGARLARRPDATARRLLRYGVVFGVVGMLPDLDLLVNAHSGPTHGLGSALIVGIAAAVLTRSPRLGVAVTAAYASHTLLDWLGSDTSPPRGIMALWPVSRTHYESSLHVFRAISRRYWQPDFWTANLAALGRELAILVPILLLSICWGLWAAGWSSPRRAER